MWVPFLVQSSAFGVPVDWWWEGQSKMVATLASPSYGARWDGFYGSILGAPLALEKFDSSCSW